MFLTLGAKELISCEHGVEPVASITGRVFCVCVCVCARVRACIKPELMSSVQVSAIGYAPRNGL